MLLVLVVGLIQFNQVYGQTRPERLKSRKTLPKLVVQAIQAIKFTSTCEWTPWQYQDDPSGGGDFEAVPDGCQMEKYQIQLVDGGAIYNDVDDTPYGPHMQIWDQDDITYIACHEVVSTYQPKVWKILK